MHQYDSNDGSMQISQHFIKIGEIKIQKLSLRCRIFLLTLWILNRGGGHILQYRFYLFNPSAFTDALVMSLTMCLWVHFVDFVLICCILPWFFFLMKLQMTNKHISRKDRERTPPVNLDNNEPAVPMVWVIISQLPIFLADDCCSSKRGFKMLLFLARKCVCV